MDITAIVYVKNEERFMPRLLQSLKDCSEIIIADDSSTDKTREIAEKFGAKVVIRKDEWDIVTEKDIKDFKDNFGFDPTFQVGDKIPNMAKFRNAILPLAKNDWIFSPDADEIVTWEFEKIKKLLSMCDQVECRLIQSPDPYRYNPIVKLFKKSKNKWVCRNHEVIIAKVPDVLGIRTENMKIDHLKKDRKPPGDPVLVKNLEYGALKEHDARTIFYLGREYYFCKEYVKAIKMLALVILTSKNTHEVAESYFLEAYCLWNLDRKEQAVTSCLYSIFLNPNMKKSFVLMSQICKPEMKDQWLKLSEVADNSGVAFP